MSNSVIIVGSSRKNGNTTTIADAIAEQYKMDIINLSDYQFTYYDYENKNITDDFLPLMKEIIEKYDTLLFATPIYWYNMSGIMKVFFDRFSDLIRIEKDWGRKLREKKMVVISNSHDSEKDLDYSFYIPFQKSAEYLGMQYIGNKHINADNPKELNNIELAFL
ncbi:FMN reductase [Flavobacterium covae]|uniref:NADPH-dependent oxidoreductase n=2 Tax=Flavobacterium TaxID=237 RepID=A0AA94JP53_9FLAO|nr:MULTISPECIES: NAD(P)H-dependent oxidoreductase [Flavobacterium]OXA80090.1 NADPH-dependent oxidoreductase [Flavobacterium columnare NBRC 100251 = ATCC 23463]AND63728.1 FMN reductase [Flavobacterium covae]MCH4830046.1 NAD(P)H-dependent oxidoreductase [Flavobacterium columnare]MCH4832574.1 NAD(P)H-dependent oxidoreductase [Flavobacterium columnare]MCJ1807775.1 NAD(P)H-dependent oxidoreductase [Flavobacterium covae]